jgi:phospholipase C
LNAVYNAVVSSPAWPRTVLVINYDEGSGFFDHVPPTAAPIPAADRKAGNTDGLRGFRVPNLIISPWSGRGVVRHGLFDHTSVLKMIEWRWDLTPLTIRDATASNLASLLDFSLANLDAPTFDVPPIVSREGRPSPAAEPTRFERLRELARTYGFTSRSRGAGSRHQR